MRRLADDEIHVWTVPRAWEPTAREILRDYAGTRAGLRRSPLGKPFVPGGGLEVGISGTTGLTVLALCRHPFGIDVERVAPLDGLDTLCALTLAPAEACEMACLPPAAQAARFYRIWVRKEALLKARGCGLAADPRELDTSRPMGRWRWLDAERDGVAVAAAVHHSPCRLVWMGAAR